MEIIVGFATLRPTTSNLAAIYWAWEHTQKKAPQIKYHYYHARLGKQNNSQIPKTKKNILLFNMKPIGIRKTAKKLKKYWCWNIF